MESRWYARATLIALLTLLSGTAIPAVRSSAQERSSAAELGSLCAVQHEPIARDEQPALLAAIPAGVAVTAFAQQGAEHLPQGTDLTLSLDLVTVAADTETLSRVPVGPTLFLVEEGTVAVTDNGRERQPIGRPGSVAGESVLVEQDRIVKLANHGDTRASVLVFGVLPPVGQLPIGPFEPAHFWIPFPEEREVLTHRQMLSAEIGALAREETLLFAACLHWSDSSAEIAPMRYPGPVGLLVLHGQAMINDVKRVGAGDCWIFPAYSALRVRAGEQLPDIVLFGALRSSMQPQPDISSGEASPSLACEGPTAG